jgi:hypothetical protein
MLRIDCTALLGPGARRVTRFVRCAHCAQADAASQKLEARCARRPRPCAARGRRFAPCRAPPAARPPARHAEDPNAWAEAQRCAACLLPRIAESHAPARLTGTASARRPFQCTVVEKVRSGRWRRASEAPRSARRAWPRAPARHQPLTRRVCVSVESEANAASYAPGHAAEHRRAVGAQHRPPQQRAATGPDAPFGHASIEVSFEPRRRQNNLSGLDS